MPIAWLYFTHMTITYGYNMYKMPKRRLRTDLTYSDWILGFVLSTVIITPQVIVLAAQWRVRR